MMTGEIGILDKIGVINSQYNDFDDLPSFMRSSNYTSILQLSAPASFDGLHLVVYRGNKQLYGPEFLSSKQRWFDQIIFKNTQSWQNDRITSEMMINKIRKLNEAK